MTQKYRQWLHQEVPAWVAEGLVSAEQGDQLLTRYPASPSSMTWGGRVLVALAVLFLGAALLLLISHNWASWPAIPRVLLLILGTTALSVGGGLAWERGRTALGVSLLMAGVLAFGSSIMLIGQIYHLGENPAGAVFLWALGGMLVALASGSRLLHLLALLLACLMVMFELQGLLRWLWVLFPLATLWQLRRHGRAEGLQTLGLILIGLWGADQWSRLFSEPSFYTSWSWIVLREEGVLFLCAWAIFLAGWALWRPAPRGRLLAWLDVFWVTVLFLLLEAGMWYGWTFVAEGMPAWPGWVLVLGVTLWAGLRLPGLRNWVDRLRLLVPLLVLWLLWSMRMESVVEQFWLSADGRLLWPSLLMHLLLFATGVRLLVQGIQRDRAAAFYGGLCVLLGLGLYRYLSLYFSYLASAGLFLVAALILLAAAFYWHRRTPRLPEGESA